MERAREDYFSLKNRMLRISSPHFEKQRNCHLLSTARGQWVSEFKVLWMHFGQLTVGAFSCRTVSYYYYWSSVSCNFKESTALWFCCQRLNVVSKQKPEEQHNCCIEMQINYLLVPIRSVQTQVSFTVPAVEMVMLHSEWNCLAQNISKVLQMIWFIYFISHLCSSKKSPRLLSSHLQQICVTI